MAMYHSQSISSYCNNVVITIKSVFRPNDFTRAHIGSNGALSGLTRAHIGSNGALSGLTRAHIGSTLRPIAPTVGKIQRLRGQSAAVVNKVKATAAH